MFNASQTCINCRLELYEAYPGKGQDSEEGKGGPGERIWE